MEICNLVPYVHRPIVYRDYNPTNKPPIQDYQCDIRLTISLMTYVNISQPEVFSGVTFIRNIWKPTI